MKTLLLAIMMGAVAIATSAPPAMAQMADDDEAAAIARAVRAANGMPAYTKQPNRASRAVRTPRNAAQARAAQVSRYTGTKKLQLPEYKPYYSGAGSYIPTTFIYQQTNGEFKILRPTASAAPTTQQGGVNAALRNIRNGAPGGRPAAPAGAPAGTNAAPPQPPTPPQVQPQGAVSNAIFRPTTDSGRPGGGNSDNLPRSNFP